jgi:hypothetical protein
MRARVLRHDCQFIGEDFHLAGARDFGEAGREEIPFEARVAMPNATRRASRHAHGIGAFKSKNLPAPWAHISTTRDRVAKRDRSVANEMHRQESGACILLLSAR